MQWLLQEYEGKVQGQWIVLFATAEAVEHTSVSEAELVTDYSSISLIPTIITHSTPLPIEAYLHTTTVEGPSN
jgi:hypothetical protein